MPHEWETLAQDPEVKPLLAVNYMRHAERVSELREVEELDRKLNDPAERKHLSNSGRLGQQNKRRKANLEAQSPPMDLTASQRDKLRKIEVVTRGFVAENIPTTEQMRHNPPGTVDHHMAWERETQPAMLAWKAARILLNPDSDAVDLANFERYRPSAETRNLYSDGQIPRKFAFGPDAKVNYDKIDWTSPETAEHVQEMINQGRVKVRTNGKTQSRQSRHPARAAAASAVCDAAGCSAQYSGNFARSNLTRHKTKTHGIREEASA